MQAPAEASLEGRNTLALPARARAFARVADDAELLEALEWAAARQLPVVPLGAGSNVVLAGDIEALVVQQTTAGITVLDQTGESVLLRVAAGHDWHALVDWALRRGFHGLENLALIPGLVGAAPIQNIGAYGVELASVVAAVHGYYLADGRAFSLDRAGCNFGYRDSVFKGRLRDRVVITAVDLRLSRRWRPVLDYPDLAAALSDNPEPGPEAVFSAVVAIRRGKLPDPAVSPNAGSFFKNPVVDEQHAARLRAEFGELPGYPAGPGRIKLSAAWLIERCGWKGRSRGAVGVDPRHALVLVNRGGGTGAELLGLAAAIAASVGESFGVELEIEPRIYGPGAA